MPSNKKTELVNAGDQFNRLTVVGFSHQDKRWRRHYIVKCVCGVKKTVQGTLLRSGNTKSCGCLSVDRKRATRLPGNRGVINQIILGYKRHARDRGISWDLTFNDVAGLIKKPCHYCGAINSNVKKTKSHAGYKYNGIDRINSTYGYFIENVVPCCSICNVAKNNMEAKEFIEWACRVAKHSAMAEQWGAV